MATITVTNTNDNGVGSLREAIAFSQPGDTITFASTLNNKTITLTSGELIIDKNLTIDGANAANLTISGNQTSRVIDIKINANYQAPNVTLKNLTIANGKTTQIGEDGAGAGVRTTSNSTLTINNVIFNNNSANGEGGGAIFAGWRSTNTVINSTFTNNSTAGNGVWGKTERGGGAIAVKSESSLLVQDSEFINNAGTNGGAINTLLGELIIENSQFIGNNTSGANGTFTYEGYGGAIYTDGASAYTNDNIGGIIHISNSLFDGNVGAGQGGGLFLYAYPPDQVIIENSTIINNQVFPDSKGDALGGGLRHGNSQLTINNSTFAYNRAYSQGGGLWVGEKSPTTITNTTFSGNRAESASGTSGLGGAIMFNANDGYTANLHHITVANNYAGWQGGGFWGKNQAVTLNNSIFAYNKANNGGNNWNIYHHTGGTFNQAGTNIQSVELNPNDTKITTSVILADPLLGELQDDGQEGYIHPLLSGSPAVNVGTPGTTTDQRGFQRDSFPDLGSYEQNASSQLPNAPSNLKAQPISEAIIKLTWKDNSDNETGFVIEKSLDNLNWDLLVTTNPNISSYQAKNLAPNTQYYYRLFATNTDGNSEIIKIDAKTYNLITGTSNNDQLNGLETHDIIKSLAGDDLLNAGAGNDKLYGGLGKDTLNGGLGKDILNGDGGNDIIKGNGGNDLLNGGAEDDKLYGNSEQDTLNGGLGKDILYGGAAKDIFILTAGEGQDTIMDFEDNLDKIKLNGITFNSLSILDSNNNTLLKNGTQTLALIIGINSSLLTLDDFQ